MFHTLCQLFNMKFILIDKLLVLQFEKQLAWIVCVLSS